MDGNIFQYRQSLAIFYPSLVFPRMQSVYLCFCFTLHTPAAPIDVFRPRVASFTDLHLIFHLLCQATALADTLAGK